MIPLNKKKKDEKISNLGSIDTARKLAEDYVNFNYDTFAEGDTYKSLEKRYDANGQRAMQNTLGQVAARTGGMASSYATSAANQSYNDWMSNLEDAARSLYESERKELGDRYSVANSMYLQDRDEQRYIEERDYDRSEDRRIEGKSDAAMIIESLLKSGRSPESIDPDLILKSGMPLEYWVSESYNMDAEEKEENNSETLEDYKNIIAEGGTVSLADWVAAGGNEATYNGLMSVGTNSNKQKTLAQYMASLSDGVFVDRQVFIDAGGDVAVYDAYKNAYDEAKAKGEAANKATVATSALNTLIATNADVDWDSEEIQQLITESGKNPLEWNALIADAQEKAQADADAKAMAKAEDEILWHIKAGKGVNTLEEELVLASGRSPEYWENYEKVYNASQAVPETYKQPTPEDLEDIMDRIYAVDENGNYTQFKTLYAEKSWISMLKAMYGEDFAANVQTLLEAR
jgi:hypothetical protein